MSTSPSTNSPSGQTPKPPQQPQPPPATNGATYNNLADLISAAKPPPFSQYLQIVSFTAAITISVSISASQGFATGGNFFGTELSDDNDPLAAGRTAKTVKSAQWLSWSAAVSSLSLIITLVLQLFLTDALFLSRVAQVNQPVWRNVPRMIIGVGSWIALGLQASALALIGQALKPINEHSGSMIQWCLLAVSLPSIIFMLYLYGNRARINTGQSTLP